MYVGPVLLLVHASRQLPETTLERPWYPTSLWHPGETIPDPYAFTVPPGLLPGKYRFEIGMYSPVSLARLPVTKGGDSLAGDSILLGNLTVPDPLLDLNAISHPLRVNVGDSPQITLLGFDLSSEPIPQGGNLDLTLYWQALAPRDRDNMVFIHFLDDSGQVIAQQDV